MIDCYTAALRILNYRFNSEVELRRKLKRKEYDAETIEATIVRLRQEKWLDDVRFAGAFVRAKSSKRVGRRRIARELEAAGVGDDTIETAIGEHVDPERERADAVALGRRKADALARRHGAAYPATEEGRQKIAAFLMRRGFDTALVLDVTREVLRSR
jgi:regulatory protein